MGNSTKCMEELKMLEDDAEAKKNRKLWLILQIGALTILIVLVIFFSAGYEIMYSTGISMLPTLRDGHICIAKKIAGELQENDIGVYWEPITKSWVNHRVIYKTEAGYIFKGDNNSFYDTFVPKEMAQYKVVIY